VARGEQEQNGYKKHVEMRGTNWNGDGDNWLLWNI